MAACAGHHAEVPRGSYATGDDAGLLVTDDAAFDRFATALRRDLERAPLPAGVSEKDARFVLAMLDALDDRWPEAVGELDRVRAIETDAKAKVMTGLSIRIWAAAGGDKGDADTFAVAADRTIGALPIDLVRGDLEMLHAMSEAFTSAAVCRDLVRGAVHPQHHRVAFTDAQTIVFQRYAAVRLVPIGARLDTVLAAHDIGLPAN